MKLESMSSSKANGSANGAVKVQQQTEEADLDAKDLTCPSLEDDEPPLPPDGGWGWVVMVASFFINLIVDGVCYTFGIINVELMTTFEGASTAETALVGSLVAAVYLMVGPFVSILANQFGCRTITIVGSIIASVFFFISSFSNSIIMMMMTYGVMGGVGFGMMYLPSIVMVGYYFDKYRAFATGIAVCGSGIGTFVFAPMATYLVKEYSWRGCNIIISGIILHGIIFGATFLPLRHRRRRLGRRHPKEESRGGDGDASGPLQQRSIVMEEIIREKERSRTLSGSSAHDGAVITHDNCIVFRPLEEDITERSEDGGIQPVVQVNGHHPHHVHANHHHHGLSSSGNFVTRRPSSRLGSRPSVAASRSDVISVLDREDVLYPGSIRNLPEFREAGGDHVKYVQSVLALDAQSHGGAEEGIGRSKWKGFRDKAFRLFDFTLLRSLTFVVLCLSGVLVFVGLLTPFVYLPMRAGELGSTREAANRMILFLGVFNTVSRIATGALADRKWIDCLVLHNFGAIVAGVATCIVPLLNSYLLLCVYAAIFGIAIASFIALRSIVFVEMLGIKKLNNAFGLTSLFQGIAVLIGSPISGALYDKTGSLTVSFIVCGALIIVGGLICLPIRRIAAWENAREVNFHEDKGLGSQYKKIDDETSSKGNSMNPEELV